ncbi:hypothetical protein [Aeromonas veronii]|uniref:hypothetical protein n=1 Tax=Aeromonas veronii TaxID=654 RepID=UPI00119D126A|nr:hypothetical protein [Aeromonas veronii]
MQINSMNGCMLRVNGIPFSGNSISIQSGTISVDGITQDITIASGQSIKVEVFGDVEMLESIFGDVTVSGSVGRVITSSGDVCCGDVTGDVETMSGDITCKKVGGNAESMSGDIIGF